MFFKIVTNYASLYKFRSKHVLNKVYGLTLCAIIVFNRIWLPHLYPTHTISVRSLSWAVNFKYRFNRKDQGGFAMPRKGLEYRAKTTQTCHCPQTFGVHCTLSIPNSRSTFLILSSSWPQDSVNSSGQGLYKVSKAFHKDACPYWLQCFPQLCQVDWKSFEWWNILDTHRKLLSVKNPAAL